VIVRKPLTRETLQLRVILARAALLDQRTKTVANIGIGGSGLWPVMAYRALRHYAYGASLQ
jgi:glucose-6-phosphate isomerase